MAALALALVSVACLGGTTSTGSVAALVGGYVFALAALFTFAFGAGP